MDTMESVRRLRFAAIVAVLFAVLAVGQTSGQSVGLFRAVEPTSTIGVRSFGTPPDFLVLRQRLVSIDFEQLTPPRDAVDNAAGPYGVLLLNLFEDTSFTALMERSEPTFSGGYSLTGRLADVDLGTVTLVVNGDVVAGTVRTLEATYRIRSTRGGLHTVSQIDPARLPPLGEPIDRRQLEEDDRGRF